MDALTMPAAMAEKQYYDMQNMKLASAPTLKQRLELAVSQAEERLKSAQRARELFDRNPDLEELLNIMQRSHF